MSGSQRALDPGLEDPDFVLCEVCRLPHRPEAERCDRCDHALGTAVDWPGLAAELPGLRRQLWAGVLLFVAMMTLNLALFDGAGAIVALAPIAWALFSGYRIHVLSAVLRHRVDDPLPVHSGDTRQ